MDSRLGLLHAGVGMGHGGACRVEIRLTLIDVGLERRRIDPELKSAYKAGMAPDT